MKSIVEMQRNYVKAYDALIANRRYNPYEHTIKIEYGGNSFNGDVNEICRERIIEAEKAFIAAHQQEIITLAYVSIRNDFDAINLTIEKPRK